MLPVMSSAQLLSDSEQTQIQPTDLSEYKRFKPSSCGSYLLWWTLDLLQVTFDHLLRRFTCRQIRQEQVSGSSGPGSGLVLVLVGGEQRF